MSGYSEIYERLNRENLNEIRVFRTQAYLAKQLSPKDGAAILKAVKLLQAKVTEHQMVLDVDGENQAMQTMLCDAITRDRLAQLPEQLEQWAASYADARQKIVEGGLQLHARHKGIMSSHQEGKAIDTVWGNDFDVRIFLGDLMTDVINIQSNGVYILPPVARKDLKDLLQELQERSEQGQLQFDAYVPVSNNDIHWTLHHAKLQNGQLLHESEYDSLKTRDQSDGYNCALYVAREAVIKKLGNQPGHPVLARIVQAENPQAMREAFVERMLGQAESKKAQKVARPGVDSRKLERMSWQQLVELEDISQLGEQPAALITEFDSFMARELQHVYNDQSEDLSDEQCVAMAQERAVKRIHERLQLFVEADAKEAQPEHIEFIGLKPV